MKLLLHYWYSEESFTLLTVASRENDAANRGSGEDGKKSLLKIDHGCVRGVESKPEVADEISCGSSSTPPELPSTGDEENGGNSVDVVSPEKLARTTALLKLAMLITSITSSAGMW